MVEINNSYITFIVMIAIIGVIAFVILSKKKNKGFRDFKNVEFSKTIHDDINLKFNQHGIDIKAKLVINLHEICHIDKWLRVKGKFPYLDFDKSNNEIYVSDDEEKEYDLIIMRAKNKKFLLRIFGLKKTFYILTATDDKDNLLYKYDDRGKRFIFKHTGDFISYGNIWTNSQNSIEYINDVSMKRLNQRIMMYLENYPDKVTHLEMEQAKKERIARTYTELEKGKYENAKKVDDTIIS